MDRAYSILTEKSISEDADFVYIKGIASTPSVDRVGDIMDPMGAKFKIPMPLIMNHKHDLPVGHVTFARPTSSGIPFNAKLPIVKETGRVKDRVDEAIHSLKYDLISAVSVGFKAVEGGVERIKSGGIRFKEWTWLELSLVTIPANSEAVITAIKSIDSQHLPPASGHEADAGQEGRDSPGVSGTKVAAFRGSVKLIPRKRS